MSCRGAYPGWNLRGPSQRCGSALAGPSTRFAFGTLERTAPPSPRVISPCTRAYQKPSVASVPSVLSVRAFYDLLTILGNSPNDSNRTHQVLELWPNGEALDS